MLKSTVAGDYKKLMSSPVDVYENEWESERGKPK